MVGWLAATGSGEEESSELFVGSIGVLLDSKYIITAGGDPLLLRRICLYKAFCEPFHYSVLVASLNPGTVDGRWRSPGPRPFFHFLFSPSASSSVFWIRGNNEGILWLNPFHCGTRNLLSVGTLSEIHIAKRIDRNRSFRKAKPRKMQIDGWNFNA